MRLVGLALAALLAGCSLSFVRNIDNRPEDVRAVKARYQGQEGQVTLREVLAQSGAPDLIVASGKRTRIYYTAFDSYETRGSLTTIVPIPGTGQRPTAAVGGLGGELVELARLDFGEDGRLMEAQFYEQPVGRQAGSVAVDSRVHNFYEDRARAARVEEPAFEDDGLDLELELEENQPKTR